MRRVARGLRRIPKRVADVAAIARGSQWSPTAMHGVRIPPVRRRWVPRSLLPTIKKDFRTCSVGPKGGSGKTLKNYSSSFVSLKDERINERKKRRIKNNNINEVNGNTHVISNVAAIRKSSVPIWQVRRSLVFSI